MTHRSGWDVAPSWIWLIVSPDELDAMIKNGEAYIVDVRNQASYDIGHIPGSRLIPAGEIANHLSELPRDKTIVTYCS